LIDCNLDVIITLAVPNAKELLDELGPRLNVSRRISLNAAYRLTPTLVQKSLIWGGVVTSGNPKGLQAFADELNSTGVVVVAHGNGVGILILSASNGLGLPCGVFRLKDTMEYPELQLFPEADWMHLRMPCVSTTVLVHCAPCNSEF
jgi:hypothetical protein